MPSPSPSQRSGRLAHAAHKKRTDNPYVRKAYLWDKGWVSRQEEQLTASGITSKLSSFKAFFSSHTTGE